MKYVGSKRSIAKNILQYVLSERKKDQCYVEPFVGGANIIDKVHGNRIGADANYYLTECLKLIRDNPESLPKNKTEASEVLYNQIKNKTKIVSDGLHGYYGFALSYGGKWWGGYCRHPGTTRDDVNESFKNALEQSRKLKDIDFVYSHYAKLKIPDQSIVYCDIPYLKTLGYKTGVFDHDKFWNWARLQIEKDHKIYISEYQAPDDFVPIWAKTKNVGFNSTDSIEKLFIHKSQQNNTFYF